MLHVIILSSAASQFLTSVDILIFLRAGQQLLCRMVVGYVLGSPEASLKGLPAGRHLDQLILL